MSLPTGLLSRADRDLLEEKCAALAQPAGASPLLASYLESLAGAVMRELAEESQRTRLPDPC